jgi:methionine sulfoxide reductase heme-binding subunit
MTGWEHSEMTDSVLWYATRGAGAVSLVLLTSVVVLGILSALRWGAKAWPRFLTTGLHRNLALLSILFLGLHIVTAVVDPFTSLGWKAALVPFSSSYRSFWLGLGVVALDLLLALVITSLVRHLIGHRSWRFIHWLAYACWPIAVVHGVGTGSDTTQAWMLALDFVCAGAVLVAVTGRVATRRAGSRRLQATRAMPGRSPLPDWSGLAPVPPDSRREAR